MCSSQTHVDKSKTSKVMSAFGSGAHGAGKKLANLFRPPTDIMCPLSFEEVFGFFSFCFIPGLLLTFYR